MGTKFKAGDFLYFAGEKVKVISLEAANSYIIERANAKFDYPPDKALLSETLLCVSEYHLRKG